MGQTTECNVRGCSDPREEIFAVTAEEAPRLEWAVCTFHARALSAGETYAIADDMSELLLGSDTPLEIVNLSVTDYAIGDSIVELMLGHDGIESQRVTFQMKPEHARSICHWVAGGPHTHDGVE